MYFNFTTVYVKLVNRCKNEGKRLSLKKKENKISRLETKSYIK